MAMKIKGIYKGFKYISQIFVVKEREMEIGHPTDVKHVAHIGWDGGSGSQPSWMREFKSPPDFSTTSTLSNPRDSNSGTYSPWSSQDYDNSVGPQSMTDVFNDGPSSDLPNSSKKSKRKKKTTTAPKSSSSGSRSSRSLKVKATTYHELQPTPNLQVA